MGDGGSAMKHERATASVSLSNVQFHATEATISIGSSTFLRINNQYEGKARFGSYCASTDHG
jgi:hypothetical protein